LILAVVSAFYHLRLGLQVVIEDYQHDFTRVIAIVLLNFYAIGGAALAIFAILKVAFQGAVA
jgi:succinate dehydrogenase / fumarate reductase membrane anchor subunit